MIKSLHKGWELKWIYWNDCSELFCISISYLVIMIFKIMGFFSSWIPFPSRLRWWIKLYITRISHALELTLPSLFYQMQMPLNQLLALQTESGNIHLFWLLTTPSGSIRGHEFTTNQPATWYKCKYIARSFLVGCWTTRKLPELPAWKSPCKAKISFEAFLTSPFCRALAWNMRNISEVSEFITSFYYGNQ